MGNIRLNHNYVVLSLGAVVLLVIFGLTLFSTTSVAQAQEISPATEEISPDEVNKVARELWCPLCSGVRLDSCELKACDQMKDVIAIKLAEGEDTEAIKTYFVEQYGPQVLGAPPLEGFNWLAWILPFVVLIGGGVFLWFRLQHLVRPSVAAVESRRHSTAGLSEYEQKLEEELKRYG